MRNRPVLAAIGVAVMLSLPGCSGKSSTILIDNRREDTIVVTLLGIDAKPDAYTAAIPQIVAAGEQGFFKADSCQGTGAIATDRDNKEIAHVNTPLCPGDKWIFEADGSDRVDRAAQ